MYLDVVGLILTDSNCREMRTRNLKVESWARHDDREVGVDSRSAPSCYAFALGSFLTIAKGNLNGLNIDCRFERHMSRPKTRKGAFSQISSQLPCQSHVSVLISHVLWEEVNFLLQCLKTTFSSSVLRV